MDAFDVILIICVALVVLILSSILINDSILESHSTIVKMTVVGKTMVAYSESEREACVLQKQDGSRVTADDNGCVYNIDEVVFVKIKGSWFYIKGLA